MALAKWVRRLREGLLGAPKGGEPGEVCPAVRFSAGTHTPAAWARVFDQLLAGRAAATPRMSIVTPLWNTKPQWLAEAAVSVFGQTSPAWEWCLVDDGSTRREFQPILDAAQHATPRVRVERFERNGGISAASNAGLRLARTEFVCFLDHDDLLHPQALEACLLQCDAHDAVYTDSNKADEDGLCDEPFCKPDWSPAYLRGVMYVGHLLCVRREAALAIGGFDSGFDGVQDFEFLLRYSERYPRIAHIPQILYHWRRVDGSLAASLTAKDNITGLQRQAVAAQLGRLHLPATAIEGPRPHRVSVELLPRSTWPLVSIITGGEPVVSTYPNLQYVKPDVSKQAGGDFLIFLDSGLQPLTADWIEQLLYHAEQAATGAVGALLLNPDRSIQHAGIAVGGGSVASNIGPPETDPTADGYAGSLAHARECTAVSAACLMIRRELFEQLGGFNKHFLRSYSGVDLCLRLRALGKRNLYTPKAVLLIGTQACENDAMDRHLLLDEWEEIIAAGDAFYRPADMGNGR